jgi:hypothetical protein
VLQQIADALQRGSQVYSNHLWEVFMKLSLALLTLFAAHSASANSIAVLLVPCTNSENVCAKVYQDFTTGQDYKGQEMEFVSDGLMRAQIYGAFTQAKGNMPVIGVEGKVFAIYSGYDFKIKIDRFASATGK